MSIAEIYDTDDVWAEKARESLPDDAESLFVAGDRHSRKSVLATLTVEGDRGVANGPTLEYTRRFWCDEYGRVWLGLDNEPLCLCAVPAPGCCAGTEP